MYEFVDVGFNFDFMAFDWFCRLKGEGGGGAGPRRALGLLGALALDCREVTWG